MIAATHPPWRAAKSERISHSFHHLAGLGKLETGREGLAVRFGTYWKRPSSLGARKHCKCPAQFS